MSVVCKNNKTFLSGDEIFLTLERINSLKKYLS